MLDAPLYPGQSSIACHLHCTLLALSTSFNCQESILAQFVLRFVMPHAQRGIRQCVCVCVSVCVCLSGCYSASSLESRIPQISEYLY